MFIIDGILVCVMWFWIIVNKFLICNSVFKFIIRRFKIIYMFIFKVMFFLNYKKEKYVILFFFLLM